MHFALIAVHFCTIWYVSTLCGVAICLQCCRRRHLRRHRRRRRQRHCGRRRNHDNWDGRFDRVWLWLVFALDSLLEHKVNDIRLVRFIEIIGLPIAGFISGDNYEVGCRRNHDNWDGRFDRVWLWLVFALDSLLEHKVNDIRLVRFIEIIKLPIKMKEVKG